jgi:hypothetical protein
VVLTLKKDDFTKAFQMQCFTRTTLDLMLNTCNQFILKTAVYTCECTSYIHKIHYVTYYGNVKLTRKWILTTVCTVRTVGTHKY